MKAAAFLVAVLPLAACGREEHVDVFAVWADDGSGALVNVYTWLEGSRPYDNVEPAEDTDYSLWIFDVNADTTEEWTGRRPGEVRWMYFMRSSGYAFLRAAGPLDIVLPLEGAEAAKPESGVTIPSPDGTRLATLTTACSNRTGTTLVDCSVEVTFRNTDFSVVGVARGVSYETEITRTQTAEGQWTPDGSFLVRLHRAGVGYTGPAYRMVPGGDPEEAAQPACDDGETETTSGTMAADGRLLNIELRDTVPVVRIIPGDGPGFPLRCFPESP